LLLPREASRYLVKLTMVDAYLMDYLPEQGQMFGSKSGYRMAHPDHIVYFNANLYWNSQKLWWGDLDVSRTFPSLIKFYHNLSKDMHGALYCLPELAGRFNHESDPMLEAAFLRFDRFGVHWQIPVYWDGDHPVSNIGGEFRPT